LEYDGNGIGNVFSFSFLFFFFCYGEAVNLISVVCVLMDDDTYVKLPIVELNKSICCQTVGTRTLVNIIKRPYSRVEVSECFSLRLWTRPLISCITRIDHVKSLTELGTTSPYEPFHSA
jgi:hypothetical protein